LWVGEKRASALVRLQDRAEGYRISPALLDGCFQPLGALLPEDGMYLPLGLRRFQLFRMPESGTVWSEAAIRIGEGNAISGEVKIFDRSGQPVAAAEGLWLRKPAGGNKECLSEIAWVPRPLEAARESSLGGRWLIFADESGVGTSIATTLKAEGATCLVVRRGEDFESLVDDSPLSGVVHLWNLNATASADWDETSLLRVQRENCGSVLRLAQLLMEKHGAERPRVWLVTRGAQFAAANQKQCFAAQAPVWGLARTIRREHPDLRCISVDLDPEFSRAEHVIEEIRHADSVEQVAWRGEDRFVPRLLDRAEEPENARLEPLVKGRLEELRWQTSARSKPGRGEVEIRVAVAGLNFRDVLNALGEYPGDAGLLGSECSGWIEQVGEDVAGLAPGDEVVAVARGSFARFVKTRADLVARKPKELRMEEAAALPVAYVTARYALQTIGNMRAGHRVLIHSAAGGVGLAAVGEAQRVGAEVYATAGSDQKREWLKSLGVRDVMNSRAFDYRREIMEQTAGRGVDLVLNSLAGEHISESLQALAPGGVFLELGKRGIWDAARVAALRPDVRYFVVDWGEEYERNPALIAAVYRGLMQDVESGALKPLPCRIFAKADAEQAFRWMAQGRHIGKIVVQMPLGTCMRADGAYLISGGLGALGLRVAGWMAAHGAGKLILVGRSAPDEEARSAVRAMEAVGAEVDLRAADVSRRDELELIFQEIKKGGKPLRGVAHAAGVLDDAVLSQQSWERFAKVMQPKMLGAWHLHTLTANVDLDFFIMFSSLASLLGSPGQGNYAASNAFLDGLALHRRTLGMPGLSINWGPWEGSGMAAEATGWQRSFPSLSALGTDKGLELWKRILALGNISQIAAFERQAHAPEIGFGGDRFARELAADSGSAGRFTGVSGARGKKLVECLREEAAKIIGLRNVNDLDVDAPLFEAGLDSLMAVEFRNVLGTAFGRPFSSTLLFDYPSVQKLATFLERAAQPASARVGAVDIENLDESAAEALLIAELGMGTNGINK
jgi:NADPH:quinone reductase-like Zn-dependent oxidoreductase/acyl carrier protein